MRSPCNQGGSPCSKNKIFSPAAHDLGYKYERRVIENPEAVGSGLFFFVFCSFYVRRKYLHTRVEKS